MEPMTAEEYNQLRSMLSKAMTDTQEEGGRFKGNHGNEDYHILALAGSIIADRYSHIMFGEVYERNGTWSRYRHQHEPTVFRIEARIGEPEDA